MIILFIIGLLLGAVSVVFALQNIASVTVVFFAWQLTGSLALIILMALLTGILITLLLLLPESISTYFNYRRLQKANANLAEELRKQKELTVFAKTTPPTESEIRDIENGASL
jgi:uncharacterized integral membrane protein